MNPKVRGIFFWRGSTTGLTYWVPMGLSFRHKLWWRFIPGTVIKVKWPKGTEDYQADPNDHYRSWLEANVGKQGWDWNWGLAGNDVTENMLTIKFRKSKEQYATLATILWS